MTKKKIITIKFEVPQSDVSDLKEMHSDGALEDLTECLATLNGRRVVSVVFSD